jgi:hypothetical protein
MTKYFEVDEQYHTFDTLSTATGIKRSTLVQRFKRGLRGADLTAIVPAKTDQTIMVDGLTLTQVAHRFGINYQTLLLRHKRGVNLTSSKDVLTVSVDGQDVSLYELSKRHPVSYQTLRQRYMAGKRGDDLTHCTHTVMGVEMTFEQIDMMFDVPVATLLRRHQAGARGDKLLDD